MVTLGGSCQRACTKRPEPCAHTWTTNRKASGPAELPSRVREPPRPHPTLPHTQQTPTGLIRCLTHHWASEHAAVGKDGASPPAPGLFRERH